MGSWGSGAAGQVQRGGANRWSGEVGKGQCSWGAVGQWGRQWGAVGLAAAAVRTSLAVAQAQALAGQATAAARAATAFVIFFVCFLEAL